jgi:MarR family 2-MHQ and catechol resistance regulon transcriptional repressor
MVQRIKDEKDHRRSLVELTDKGRNLIEQVCPENDKMYCDRFGVWSREEKKELIRLISLYHKEIKLREGDNRLEKLQVRA